MSIQTQLYWLNWLNQKLEAEGNTEFLIERMQPNWLDNPRHIWLYRLGVGLLVGLPVGMLFWLYFLLTEIFTSGVNLGLLMSIVRTSVVLPLLVLIYGSFFALIYSFNKRIQPVGEFFSWSWNKVKQGLAKVLKISIIGGLIIGLLFTALGLVPEPGIIMGLIIGLFIGLITGIEISIILAVINCIGLIIKILISFFFAIVGSEFKLKTRKFPNQEIFNSAINAAIYTLLSTLILALLLRATPQGVEQRSLILPGVLLSGFLVGSFNGGLACLQHLSLRLLLWSQGKIPWNYAHFLNQATEQGFVHREGGCYRFDQAKIGEAVAQFGMCAPQPPKILGMTVLRARRVLAAWLTLGFFLLFTSFTFNVSYIIGHPPSYETMTPMLQKSDQFLFDTFTYRFRKPQRGDIIFFAPSEDLQQQGFSSSSSYMRLLVGLPGDTINIKQGLVYLNGESVKSDMVRIPQTYEYKSRKIPDDSYFFLGTNPNYSRDPQFFMGLIEKKYIFARAVCRLWPLHRLGPLTKKNWRSIFWIILILYIAENGIILFFSTRLLFMGLVFLKRRGTDRNLAIVTGGAGWLTSSIREAFKFIAFRPQRRLEWLTNSIREAPKFIASRLQNKTLDTRIKFLYLLHLFGKLLDSISKVYFPVLLLYSPAFIFVLLIPFISQEAKILFFLIEYLCVCPIFACTAIFYTYQKLNKRVITARESWQAARRKLPRLIVSQILFWSIVIPPFTLMIIPGIYVGIRLIFMFYMLAIEDISVIEAFKRSWQLTKGHWWLVFWALLLWMLFYLGMGVIIFLGILEPLGLSSAVSYLTANIILPANITLFLLSPVLLIYPLLISMKLVDLA